MSESESRGNRSVWVQMLDPEIVKQVRALHALEWGSRRIARELGIARNSVKRYVREGERAETQTRPKARVLDDTKRALACELLDGPADGNGAVVQRLLREKDIDASLRTVQRAVASRREEKRAAQIATVRFETAPGHQMQIDFGEKWVHIATTMVRVFFFVAVLGYSRRIFVRASLSQRQDDWREGLDGAFRRFGGVPQQILIDRAGALVVGHDRDAGTARIHPAFAAFCKDWDVSVKACRPYRARTKGKTESGVGYVKRNAIARLPFTTFAELESHLERWMSEADERIHGSTHERPRERFERDEKTMLRPLPERCIPVRERRLKRRVASDCFVDIDTIRYSVPHRLVRKYVEVLVGERDVTVFDRNDIVARHARSSEPHARIVDPAHFEGIYRSRDEAATEAATPLERNLEAYASYIGGAS
jgi:transposase